jgi:hypothetical protein
VRISYGLMEIIPSKLGSMDCRHRQT